MVKSPFPVEIVRMADLGSTIMLRDSIDALFDRLEAESARPVVLDFTGVEFMSRSSTHEYLTLKSKSRLLLSESGIGPEVARMMALVEGQLDRSRSGVARTTTTWSTAPLQTI